MIFENGVFKAVMSEIPVYDPGPGPTPAPIERRYAFFGIVKGAGVPLPPPSNLLEPVYLVASTNVPLTGLGELVIDGESAGYDTTNRILLVGQALAIDNGPWLYAHSSTAPAGYRLTRPEDFKTNAQASAGFTVLVEQGDSEAGTFYSLPPAPRVLGVSDIPVAKAAQPVFSAKTDANPEDPDFLDKVIVGVCVRPSNDPNIYHAFNIVAGEIVPAPGYPYSYAIPTGSGAAVFTMLLENNEAPAKLQPATVLPYFNEYLLGRDVPVKATFNLTTNIQTFPTRIGYAVSEAFDADAITHVKWDDGTLPTYTGVFPVEPVEWKNADASTENRLWQESRFARKKSSGGVASPAANAAVVEARLRAPTLTVSQEEAIIRFVKKLEALGIFSLLDGLFVFGAATRDLGDAANLALMDFIMPARNATLNGNMLYIPDEGFVAGDANAYIDTTIIPSAPYSPTNNYEGVLLSTQTEFLEGADYGAAFGAKDFLLGGDVYSGLTLRDDVGNMNQVDLDISFANQGAELTFQYGSKFFNGAVGLSRASGANVSLYYVNGLTSTYPSVAVNAAPTLSRYVCNMNEHNLATPVRGFTNKAVRGYAIGGAMSVGNHVALWDEVEKYLLEMRAPYL